MLERFAAGLYRLVGALGFGATIMFIIFAPVLFSILPDAVPNGRHLAGQTVSAVIMPLQIWGVAGGLLMAALGGYLERDSKKYVLVRVVAGLVIAGFSAASLLWVTPSMEALRSSMGVIDTIALDDPRRVAFNGLHRWSSALHLVVLATVAALVAMPVPFRPKP